LGVRIPWESTGLVFINTLIKNRNQLQPYLHDLKRSAPDPEDSALHFQTLLSRLESALNDEKEEARGGNPELLAYESQIAPPPYEVRYVDEGTDEGWEVNKTSNEYHGFDTNAEGDYGGYEEGFEDAQEFDEGVMNEEGVPQPFYDSYDNPDIHIPTPIPEHQAYSTQLGSGYGGRGRGYSRHKGGYRPYGYGKGRGGKGGYHPKGYPKGQPKGKGKGVLDAMREKAMLANEANTATCAAKGCTQPSNLAFRFCYPCHQKGKQQGYLLDKHERKVVIRPSSFSNPNHDKTKHKRAFEAMCDSLTEDQMSMIVQGGQELRADVATATAPNEALIKRIRSASGQ
jgi:hypothetical protein